MANYYSSCGWLPWLPFGLGKIGAEGVGTCGTSTELNDGMCQLVEGVGTCGTTTELKDGTCQLVEGVGTCGALTELKDGTCQPIESILNVACSSAKHAFDERFSHCYLDNHTIGTKWRMCPHDDDCSIVDYSDWTFNYGEGRITIPTLSHGDCHSTFNAFSSNEAFLVEQTGWSMQHGCHYRYESRGIAGATVPSG